MRHIEEVDGLRAVAVIAVLVYHAGFGEPSGGFVGVDVFFVISGYLITGILLSDLDGAGVSLSRFYVRRILRIAPALFITLLLTAIAFHALFPPALSDDLFQSLTAATLSYSNLWFYFTVDYFGNVRNPVLHTWSLAVEEQFYLLFPLLLFAIGKLALRRHLLPILLAVLAVSLVAAGTVAADNQAKAFYFPWLRAWELLAGAVLAVSRKDFAAAIRHRGLMADVGLAAIVFSCIAYDEKMTFPGYSALLPVAGTAAVIAGEGAGGVANYLLRTRPMRWIGKISYSLYLVHWPIVCAAAVLMSLYTNKVRVAVIAASLVLAWISWRFVETPFRRMAGRVENRRVLLAFAVMCVAVLPCFFVLQHAGSLLWQRFPDALAYSTFLKPDVSSFRAGTCFLTPKFPDLHYFDPARCLSGKDGRPGVLVIGDSHAANIVAGLAAQHSSVNVLQATAAGCKPTLDSAGPAYCSGLMKRVLLEWLPSAGGRVDYVVIAARWSGSDVEPLRKTIAYLQEMKKHVILYGPTPEYSIYVPLLLAYERILGASLRERLFISERRQLDQRFRSTFAGMATYFSPMDNLCSARSCAITEGNEPLMFDRDHFNEKGVARVVRAFPLP